MIPREDLLTKSGMRWAMTGGPLKQPRWQTLRSGEIHKQFLEECFGMLDDETVHVPAEQLTHQELIQELLTTQTRTYLKHDLGANARGMLHINSEKYTVTIQHAQNAQVHTTGPAAITYLTSERFANTHTQQESTRITHLSVPELITLVHISAVRAPQRDNPPRLRGAYDPGLVEEPIPARMVEGKAYEVRFHVQPHKQFKAISRIGANPYFANYATSGGRARADENNPLLPLLKQTGLDASTLNKHLNTTLHDAYDHFMSKTHYATQKTPTLECDIQWGINTGLPELWLVEANVIEHN